MSFWLNFLYSQFLNTPKYPTKEHTGEVIIITGSNVGLGLEAARHLVRLNAAKVILACRSTSKAEAAKRDIERTEKRSGVVEAWPLDLTSYESVKEFANRCKTLPRLDAVVENAAVFNTDFSLAESHETTITTNVISTFLLGLLLLPKLRETASKFNTTPILSIVSSDVSFLAQFNERKAKVIFDELDKDDKSYMQERYATSKLIEVFAVRALAPLLSASNKPAVILNCLNPGFCHSSLRRNWSASLQGIKALSLRLFELGFARTTEVGSRTLIAAIDAGMETHGQYMHDCVVAPVAPIVNGSEGPEIQRRVWSELSAILKDIEPNALKNI